MLQAVNEVYPGVFDERELKEISRILEEWGMMDGMIGRRFDGRENRFLMVFMDLVGILNNTNTKDALMAYGM